MNRYWENAQRKHLEEKQLWELSFLKRNAAKAAFIGTPQRGRYPQISKETQKLLVLSSSMDQGGCISM